MPGPKLPFTTAAAVAAGDYRADQFDSNYLYFLQHLRSEGNSYVVELPSDGDSPAFTLMYETPPDGEAQIASAPSPGRARSNRPVEEDNPAADIPWYESLDNIYADYREWLRNMRVVDGHMVLEVGGKVVRYEMDEGLQGVIWPTHIIERPESGFKERLMHVLSKPFSQEEYDEMVGRATIRILVRKEW